MKMMIRKYTNFILIIHFNRNNPYFPDNIVDEYQSPDEEEKNIRNKVNYYDTMGGRLSALKIIEENVCEDSHSVNVDKKITGNNSYLNLTPNNNEDINNYSKRSKLEGINKYEDYKNNTNTNTINNKKALMKKKQNENRKEKDKENCLLLWKKLKIENIIPKNKLLSRDAETIFYKGELLKYSNPKSQLNNQICYRKFFVLDRTYLK